MLNQAVETKEALETFVESLDRVLAVQNYGSSGSKFFHSLVDGHPNILTAPSLYMIGFYTFWPEASLRNCEQVIAEFVASRPFWFDPKGYAPWGTDKMGPRRDETVFVDRDSFIEYLRAALGERGMVSRRRFFQAVHVAYAAVLGRNLNLESAHYVMVYPFHTSEPSQAVALYSDFPKTRILHCIREPIQTLGSTAKLASTRWAGFWQNTCTTAIVELSQMLLDTYLAHDRPFIAHGYSALLPALQPQSKGIRLEDLHQRPRETLEKFCRWLDIPWDDALLQSTYDGKVWWNRPESVQVSGFSAKPIARTHDDVMSRFDRFRLEVLFSGLKRKLGYPSAARPRSAAKGIAFAAGLLVPLKMEILSVVPSRFSLPKTWQVLTHGAQVVVIAAKRRSLRGLGLREVPGELGHFVANWLLLTPLRSYVWGRVMLFRSWRKLSNPQLEVVDIL